MLGQLDFLSPLFLEAMNDIGRYGFQKHGKNSFQFNRISENKFRTERTETREIGKHAAEHFAMYERGELHDHFKTRKHQLAAAAFNAMMEFYFAGLEEE